MIHLVIGTPDFNEQVSATITDGPVIRTFHPTLGHRLTADGLHIEEDLRSKLSDREWAQVRYWVTGSVAHKFGPDDYEAISAMLAEQDLLL